MALIMIIRSVAYMSGVGPLWQQSVLRGAFECSHNTYSSQQCKVAVDGSTLQCKIWGDKLACSTCLMAPKQLMLLTCTSSDKTILM